MKKNIFPKYRVILIILSVLLLITYIYSYVIYTKNNIPHFNERNIYGFHGEEDYQGIQFNWTSSYEATKIIRFKERSIKIPIFCLKPDIIEKPVEVNVYIINTRVAQTVLRNNDLHFFEIESLGKDFDIGDYIKLRFVIDTLWSPSDYNLEDKRMLGIGVGKVFQR